MEFRRSVHLDVTLHNRTPAEESLYESYLLRKHSDVGSLYASNVYEGQCFQKALKHLNKERDVQAAEIDREMTKMQKKMNDLKLKRNHVLGQKQHSFGCLQDLKLNASNGYHSQDMPSPPFLGRKGQQSRSDKRKYSRTLSDVANVKYEETICLPSQIKPERLQKASSLEERSKTSADDEWNAGAQSQNSKELDNRRNISRVKLGPMVFVTEMKEEKIKSPRNSRKIKHEQNSPQLHRLKVHPSRTSTSQRRTLSPIQTIRLQQYNANMQCPSMNIATRADVGLRVVKSHQDLTDLDDSIVVKSRPRSLTFSGDRKIGDDIERIKMHYVPINNRSKSANFKGFPKID